MQATGVCSWRAEGIKHRKNEVFIDVIENVGALNWIRLTFKGSSRR